MRGHLGPACNAVGYVDRQVWGVNHLYTQPVWTRLKVCSITGAAFSPYLSLLLLLPQNDITAMHLMIFLEKLVGLQTWEGCSKLVPRSI
jgi:hypothetical protein